MRIVRDNIAKLLKHRLIRFGLQSGLSYSLNITFLVVLHEFLKLSVQIAFGISVAAVFLINFFVLKYFVFQSKKGEYFTEFARMIIVSGGLRVVEYWVFGLLVKLNGSTYYPLLATLVLGTSAVSKYLLFKFYVFWVSSVRDTEPMS